MFPFIFFLFPFIFSHFLFILHQPLCKNALGVCTRKGNRKSSLLIWGKHLHAFWPSFSSCFIYSISSLMWFLVSLGIICQIWIASMLICLFKKQLDNLMIKSCAFSGKLFEYILKCEILGSTKVGESTKWTISHVCYRHVIPCDTL